MKIYTKTGDKGDTGLFGGARASKSSDRVTAYGEVDELNSCLGFARVQASGSPLAARLHAIQCDLFSLGAELAKNPTKDVDLGVALVGDKDIEQLEGLIDELEAELPPLKTFILPGGSPAGASLHVCRTVCRRAERSVVRLAKKQPVRMELVRYLNRLSDLIFVMARWENQRAGVQDVPWLGRKGSESA
jgi:cob(I)alamin adenosyltransferase